MNKDRRRRIEAIPERLELPNLVGETIMIETTPTTESQAHTQESLEAALRAAYRGRTDQTAGIELLIRQQRTIYPRAPWIETAESGAYATVNTEKLLYETGVYSGGERRIIAIAVSFLSGEPVDLSDAVTGLDRHGIQLVLAAIATGSGWNEAGRTIGDVDGKPALIDVKPIFEWP